MKVKENNASNTEIKQRQREHNGIYRHNKTYIPHIFRLRMLPIFFITILVLLAAMLAHLATRRTASKILIFGTCCE